MGEARHDRGARPRGLALRVRPAVAGLGCLTAGAAALVLLPVGGLAAAALGGGFAVLRHLAATVLPAALADTLLLLSGVAAVAGTVGFGSAWLVTAYRFPGSAALAWLLPLPLAVPTYVAAFVWVELLDAAGPVQSAFRALAGYRLRSEYAFPEPRSLPGCILVMSAVLYPYVFVPVRAALLALGPAPVDAARTLGAGFRPLALGIGLPAARAALAVGLSLALLETLNDIGATEYLGVQTLTLSAYVAWLNRGDLPGAAQIACLALVAVIALIGAERHWRGRLGRAAAAPDPGRQRAISLGGVAGAAATLFCAAPVALGLAIPTLFLLREVGRRDLFSTVDPAFWSHAGTTAALAGGATTLVVALAVPMALLPRWSRGGAGLTGLATLGYALPGTFLVLGLLAAAAPVGASLLTGSVGGLVAAYLIRFLRVAAGPLAAQLDGAGRQTENAALGLGARPLAVIRLVQLPILRPALGAAALLVLVDCLKELPATLLLRPLNVETLATLVYAAAARGSFEDGAPAALLIVAACLGPVVWLTTTTSTTQPLAPEGNGEQPAQRAPR